jgi:hypothetical protein
MAGNLDPSWKDVAEELARLSLVSVRLRSMERPPVALGPAG